MSTTSGFVLERLEDGPLGVGRLADGLDVVLGVEHAAEAAPHDGVVVDDEHADVIASGTSATSVVPDRRRDSIAQPPADEADPLAHADEPEALLADALGSNPRPSSSTTAATDAVPLRQHDADVRRVRVLDDVRERLLDDAVERRLDLGRQPLVAELRLEVDASPVCSPERLDEPLDRRDEPEVVERRRPQLDREPAHVLQRRDDELADATRPPPAPPRPRDALLERLQAEQDRGQRLAGLVVELAREPLPLELLCLDDATDASRLTRCESSTAIAARARERLREPQILVAERRVRRRLVVRDRRPRSAVPERRAGRRAPSGRRVGARPLVDLRVLEHRVDALARPRSSTRPGFRAGEVELHAHDAEVPSPSAAATRSAVAGSGSAISTSRLR